MTTLYIIAALIALGSIAQLPIVRDLLMGFSLALVILPIAGAVWFFS